MKHNKSILFLNAFPCDEKKSNLYRKFKSQVESAGRIFEKVFYTSYDDENIYLNLYGDEERITLGKNSFKGRNFLIVNGMVKYLAKWLKKNGVDYVYMRHSAPMPSFYKTMGRLSKSGTKIMVEIPTYPGTNEGKNSSRRIHYFMAHAFEKIFGGAYTKNIAAYALIGEEAHSYRGVPAINIQNGLNVEKIPMKTAFEEHEGEIHILVVAMLSYWHGYDRLINGLAQYYEGEAGEYKVHVHICGKSADGTLEKLQQITKEKNISDYVHFEGYIGGDELIKMFDKCDIACGSLGLFRQNIIVDTTLKIPEYTSRGIPFIYCTPSVNVEKSASYCMKAEENDSDINIRNVIDFYERLDKENVSEEMRRFALDKLDWTAQLESVIDFVESKER